MFLAIRDRLARGREEGGFTLIELMVVVLIIAILIAIAIPTFLGARKRAQDKQAQSNLRNALTAEKTYYVDNQEYTTSTTDLGAIESALDFATDNGWQRGVQVEALSDTNNGVLLRSESKSGTYFCLLDLARTPAAAVEGKSAAGTYFATSTDAVCVGETFGAGW